MPSDPRRAASAVTVASNDRTYGYDDEGNRTSRTRNSTAASDSKFTTYDYDHRNRLIKVTFEDNSHVVIETLDYIYDAFDRLVRRTHDADGAGSGAATEALFVWDGNDSVLEFDGNGSTDISRRTLYGPGADMALAEEEVTSTSTAGVTNWLLTDNLGSIREVVQYQSGTGAVIVNAIDYDAFGRRLSQTDGNVQVRPGYAGYFRDETTGMYQTESRVYDPQTAKWMGEDWIGFAGGDANLGRYVQNSVTFATDPTGRDPWSAEIGTQEPPPLLTGDSDLPSDFDLVGDRAHGGVKSEGWELGQWGTVYDQVENNGMELTYCERVSLGIATTAFPPSQPNYVVEYNDGYRQYYYGGGPSNGDLAGQATLVAGAAGAAGRGAGAAARELAQEVAETAAQEATGLPVVCPTKSPSRKPPAEASHPPGSLGAARGWTMKARLKAAQLPTSGKIRYVPPKGHPPTQPLPRGPNGGYLDRFGNEWLHGRSITPGEPFEWDVQIGRNATPGFCALSRDGRHVNVSLGGEVTH